MTELGYALRKAGLIFACIAGPLFVVGAVWAHTEHHAVGFTVPALYFLAAGLVAVFAVFTQTQGRKNILALTEEQRKKEFSNEMWLLGIAATLVVVGLIFREVL
jgi:hypothetical protein